MRRALLLLSCATALLLADSPAKPLRDRDLGLAKGSVFEVLAPPRYQDEASEPGVKKAPKRINAETPPVIPHGIADSLPITRSSNLCVDCHAVSGPKKKGEPTPIPASHYLDLRRDPEHKAKQVAGSRMVCTLCHVARTDAPSLVANRFRP
ncbi:nitrate reductase cytochrome c-type subunit [Geothrix sp. PMB-07]|uniref:nitrate reductase cytochrome c-type subunit n=1 Tax=Geothrix sp. PMB-07 TaxID=3068640 RepID=UPI002741D2AF|nr:nitrate reductase cytochrome c-type subunit [Geothrix sp. PMB-07]WLT31110.1 nitrate reductase cytochrome c-type subunit [Geothrix sp. PMB-07]